MREWKRFGNTLPQATTSFSNRLSIGIKRLCLLLHRIILEHAGKGFVKLGARSFFVHIFARCNLMDATYRAPPHLFPRRRFGYLDINLRNIAQFDIQRLHADERIYVSLIEIKVNVVISEHHLYIVSLVVSRQAFLVECALEFGYDIVSQKKRRPLCPKSIF